MDTELKWTKEEGGDGPFWYVQTAKWLYNIHKEGKKRFTVLRHAQAHVPDGSIRDVEGVDELTTTAPTLKAAMAIAEQWHRSRDGDDQPAFDAPYCPYCHHNLTDADLKQLNRLT